MDYYESWLLSLEETVQNIIAYDANIQQVIQLFDMLVYPGVHDCSYTPMSFERLVFIQGNQEENYSQEEMSFMSYSDEATLIFKLSNNYFSKNLSNFEECTCKEITFFYVHINCESSDRDFVACALTKVINKAFDGFNIILFKHTNELSFGIKRLNADKAFQDFIISRWLNKDYTSNISELAFDNFGECNIFEFYCYFCEHIVEASHLVSKRHHGYDNLKKPDFQFIQTLNEIHRFYGIDTTGVIQRYWNTFEQSNHSKYDLYDEISYELRFFGLPSISSYEMLEIVEEQSKKLLNNKPVQQQSIYEYDDIDFRIGQFGDEVFDNAEKLLECI